MCGNVRALYRPWAFFSFDLALTWIPLWLVVLGQRLEWFERSFALIAVAGGSAVVSAVLFVYTTDASGFARDFWVRVVDVRRIGLGWWPVILVLPLAQNVLAITLSLWWGESPAQFDLSPAFVSAPIAFLAFTLVFGPIPEELGWRGYGLDALRTRMNLLEAGFVLGFFWGLWHVPLIWIEGSFQHGLLDFPPSLLSYFIQFIPLSLVMSWIYYRTNRSTLAAILVHFAVNAADELFSLTLFTRVLQGVVAILVAALIVVAERSLFLQREFWLNVGNEETIMPEKRGSDDNRRCNI